MEQVIRPVVDYAVTLIVERWPEAILVVGMIGVWRWLMGHKLRNRIAALEARERSSGISQVITVHHHGNVIHDYGHQLRDAIDAEKTTQNLRETIRDLPQIPLGDGHTYAELPNHTNIVTMADGSMRLALPISLSASFEGELEGELSATVELKKRDS